MPPRPPVFSEDVFSPAIFSFPDGSRIFVDPPGGPQIGTPINIGTAANNTGTTLTVTVGASGVPAGVTIFAAISTAGGDTITGLPSVADNVNGAYAEDVLNTSGSGLTKGALSRFSNNAALVENDTITATISDLIEDEKAMTVCGGSMVSSSSRHSIKSVLGATDRSGTPDSGPITTTTADQLLIGVLTVTLNEGQGDELVTEDPDYLSSVDPAVALAPSPGAGRLIHIGTRGIGAIETNNYAPTLSDATRFWVAGLASYKAAG